MKKCKKCSEEKPLVDFYKGKSMCKQCYNTRYVHKCIMCYIEFKSGNLKQKYCSKKCEGLDHRGIKNNNYGKGLSGEKNPNWQGGGVKCVCEICGADIIKTNTSYTINTHNYCSKECKNKGNSLFYSDENHPRYNSTIIPCKICGIDLKISKERLSRQENFYCSQKCHNIGHGLVYRGEKAWNYGLTPSKEVRDKISKSRVGRFRGKLHPRYNPNLSDEERINRRQLEGYKNFIKNVYERDNYTCQLTNKRGGNLVVHHLNGYNWDKENRLNSNNVITISEEIHDKFHKEYGYGNNTKEQFEEFKNKYKILESA